MSLNFIDKFIHNVFKNCWCYSIMFCNESDRRYNTYQTKEKSFIQMSMFRKSDNLQNNMTFEYISNAKECWNGTCLFISRTVWCCHYLFHFCQLAFVWSRCSLTFVITDFRNLCIATSHKLLSKYTMTLNGQLKEKIITN
jgi:hypothetical protein